MYNAKLVTRSGSWRALRTAAAIPMPHRAVNPPPNSKIDLNNSRSNITECIITLYKEDCDRRIKRLIPVFKFTAIIVQQNVQQHGLCRPHLDVAGVIHSVQLVTQELGDTYSGIFSFLSAKYNKKT